VNYPEISHDNPYQGTGGFRKTPVAYGTVGYNILPIFSGDTALSWWIPEPKPLFALSHRVQHPPTPGAYSGAEGGTGDGWAATIKCGWTPDTQVKTINLGDIDITTFGDYS
jgi:hypothetical protein